jgi:adenine-specific DNA-methyltransferase
LTNLSKIKRERMLAYLEQLKALNDDEEHIRAITEIENALTEKKYGLVWEEHSEQVDEMLAHNIPVFIEDETRKIVADEEEPYNFLLEGDNLHSLKLLEKTHKGKIDVIYIDPPYNTGAKNWKYNNHFVDSNDTFRHSKWISFMNARLLISKDLLSENGIIVVTIDDYEVENLTLLMNQIFGEENRLGTVVIKNNPSGRSTTSGFSISHEYALFYSNNPSVQLGRLPRSEKQINRYKEKDSKGSYEWVNFRKHGGYKEDAPTMYYPIYIKYDGSDFKIPRMKWNSTLNEYDVLEEPNLDEFVSLPIDENGRQRRWKWGLDKANKSANEMSVRQDRNKRHAVYIKSRMKEEGMLPLSIWDDKKYSSTEYGNNLLSSILKGKFFDYPKSLYAVIDCIKVASENPSAIVLDFFAGSGTTGHAVAQLNAEDGGMRRYILCTNNENNICEEVTYQRLKNIQTDLPHNLKYFKTEFIKKFNQDESISSRMMEHIKELIELENHIEVDGKKVIMLEHEEQLPKVLESIQDGGKLFIPSGFFLSQADQSILDKKDITVIEIPEYYFRNELREVGEL